jgi:uncharacterized protein YndB with AHSA1/START domain
MIEGDRVVHEARYAHPPERVWQALTDPAELAAWLMPNDFVAAVGARFRRDARPAHDAPFECEVLELDPPRRMRARWVVRGAPTTVTYELRADGDGTVLRVEHDGLPADEQRNFDEGWPGKLHDGIPSVLDGRWVSADASTTDDGLTRHPALAVPDGQEP